MTLSDQKKKRRSMSSKGEKITVRRGGPNDPEVEIEKEERNRSGNRADGGVFSKLEKG